MLRSRRRISAVPTGLAGSRHSDPAFTCRAITCRPCGAGVERILFRAPSQSTARRLAIPKDLVPNHPPKNLTIATTGASGAIFLRHLLLAVERDERVETVNFIASDSALRVMAEELGLKGRSNLVGQILGAPARNPSGSSGSRASRKIQLPKLKSNRTLTSGRTWPAVLIPPTP